MSNEVEIKLNSAQFIKSLKRMKSEVKGFGVAAGKLAVLGVIMKKVGDGFKRAFDEINKMNHAARASAASITTLQTLSVAAQKVGEDTGTAAGAIKQLSDGVNDAQDGTGKFADVFRRLGINAEYMAGLSADQQIFALSDAISNADSATRQWALKTLGGDIEALGPAIEKGTQGINDMNAGTLKFSQDTADQLAKVDGYWQDVWTNVKTIFGEVMAFIIKKFNGLPQAWAAVVLSIADLAVDLGKILTSFFAFDFKETQRAADRLKDNLVKNAGLIGDAYTDARKEVEKPADGDLSVADIERDEKSRKAADKAAEKSAKDRAKAADDLAKKEAKLAETKSKNSEIGLKPDELRAKLIEDEKAQVEKINKMRGEALDPGEFGMGAEDLLFTKMQNIVWFRNAVGNRFV